MCMTNVLSKKYNSVNYHKRQFILWKLYIIFQFVLLVFNYVYISDLKLTNKRMDKNVPTFIWIKMYQHLSGILVFLIHFWTNFKKSTKEKRNMRNFIFVLFQESEEENRKSLEPIWQFKQSIICTDPIFCHRCSWCLKYKKTMIFWY